MFRYFNQYKDSGSIFAETFRAEEIRKAQLEDFNKIIESPFKNQPSPSPYIHNNYPARPTFNSKVSDVSVPSVNNTEHIKASGYLVYLHYIEAFFLGFGICNYVSYDHGGLHLHIVFGMVAGLIIGLS